MAKSKTPKIKQHRGEIVEAAVRQSGKAIQKIADEIGYNRTHMYVLFGNPDLDWDIIIAIGKSIKHDFKEDFPQMFIPSDISIVQESETQLYSNQSKLLKDCMQEKNDYKNKYYALLEEHNALLKQKLSNKKG